MDVDSLLAGATPAQLAKLLALGITTADQLAAAEHNASGPPVSGGGPAGGPPHAEESHPGPGAEPPPVDAAPEPTSLDHLETTVTDSPVKSFLSRSNEEIIHETTLDETTWSARWRHASWAHIRRRVFAGLKRTNQNSSRVAAFAQCGSGSWVEFAKDDPTRFRLRCTHCHDRLCTPCANLRSLRIRDALIRQLAGRPAKFITLTLAGGDTGLVEKIDRLYKHFRALRAHPFWAERIDGGAAFLEIKYSDKAKRWHPHLHIICEGKWIDQGELSECWRGISRDSFIVDVRAVRDDGTVMRYVTKYASKPLNTSFIGDPKLLDEAIAGLKGRRLCLCFGPWYGTQLSLAEDEELADDMVDAGEWQFADSWDGVLADASTGQQRAQYILQALGMHDAWRLAVEHPPR